ncbi:unnamed protein product, partial [Mesorhabditis spiculigera]
MDTEQYPSIRELSLFDMTILKALKTLNWDQKQQMSNRPGCFHIGPQKFNKMTADEKERLLEEDIRKLAKMGTTQEPKLRPKRAARVDPVVDLLNGGNMTVKFQEDFPASDDDHNAGSIAGNNSTQLQIEESGGGGNETIPEGEGGKEEGFTWEVAVLSPEAFIFELMDPDFMVVLAPRAFNTWVLSPEAFIVQILVPKFFEPRVLSPEALIIDVLSPDFLSPKVASGESSGVKVLSPNILSPRVLHSDERFMVEILSPHILSGKHSEEEEEDNISVGGLETHEGHHHGPVAGSESGESAAVAESNEPFAPGHLHPGGHLTGHPRIFRFGPIPG